MSRRRVPFLSGFALVVVLVVGIPSAALAAFTAIGLNSGNAAAATFPPPGKPTVTDGTSNVTVAWTATTLSTGRAVDNYQVRRTVGTTTTTVCTTTNLTCTDTRQPSTATYVVVGRVGNWTSTSPSTTFASDYSAPVSTLSVAPAVNGAGWVQSNNPAYTLSAVDSGGSGVKSVSYKVNGGATVTTNANSVTFNLALQGNVSIQYWSTDNVNNTETARTTVYKVDGVAPTASNVAISNDTGASATDRITNAAAQNVSGTTEANATVKVTIGSTVKNTTANGSGNWTATGFTLAEGQQNAVIETTDAAGNTGTTTVQLRLDTVAPTASANSPTAGADYTDTTWSQTCASQGGPGICGSASDTGSGVQNITYELRKSGLLGGNYQCYNGSAWSAGACGQQQAMDSGPTPWWTSVPTNDMPNGFLIFSIQMRLVLTVTDVAGNQGAVTITFSKF